MPIKPQTKTTVPAKKTTTPRLTKPNRPAQNKQSKKASCRQNISSGGAYEGVFGYSRAVRVGNQVHVSGTCAPVGYESESAYAQARAALSIIDKALREAGASFEDVVRTVVYIVDMSDAADVARAHSDVFGTIRPASTLVAITSTLRRWQRVEIETYAILQ